jgi:hypothetical protein
VRAPRNRKLLSEMCKRFVTLLAEGYRQDLPTMAARLGYEHASTLHRVARGLNFLDAEKLATLYEQTLPDGSHPNLNWLISGAGGISVTEPSDENTTIELQTLLSSLPTEVQKSAIAVLGRRSVEKRSKLERPRRKPRP